MAKLYWRIKKNGKWTWVPAVYDLDPYLGDRFTNGERVTLWWPSEDEAVE